MTPTECLNLDPALFECAVIRLASMQPARSQPGQLLFASVSLLPLGRQRPTTSDGVEVESVGRTEKRLYFRRFVLAVDTGLSWYRGLGTAAGNLTPVPEHETERTQKTDGVPLSVASLVDRPAWPRLGLSLARDLMVTTDEPAEPCPFVGSIASRIHRRFGSATGFEEIVEDAKCVHWLEQWVHVDLRQYPEYLGSAVLIVQDPIVRRIDSFFVSTPSGGENQVVRIVPRFPGRLQNLSLTLFERQAQLLSRFETHPVPSDGLLVVPSDELLGATGFVLSHGIYGALQATAATPYLRSVGFNLMVEERSAVIEVPLADSDSAATSRYEATTFSSRQTVSVGDSSVQNVDVRIEEASFRRQKAFAAAHYEQTWLEAGDKEGALSFVRSRLHRARHTVLVADPYLGFLQMRQFMFAISHPGVTVTLLTSRLAFESQYAEDGPSELVASPGTGIQVPKGRAKEFARFNELQNGVKDLKKHIKGDVDVWVLPGDSPELHDRFLVVDGIAWVFGGSFNGLGDRASLVIRLPEPDGVLARLSMMVSRSRSLEEHIKLRELEPAMSRRPVSLLSRCVASLRHVLRRFSQALVTRVRSRSDES